MFMFLGFKGARIKCKMQRAKCKIKSETLIPSYSVGAIHESPVIETMNLYPLFLLVREAQKKKLGKKKHAVEGRG